MLKQYKIKQNKKTILEQYIIWDGVNFVFNLACTCTHRVYVCVLTATKYLNSVNHKEKNRVGPLNLKYSVTFSNNHIKRSLSVLVSERNRSSN